MSMKDEKQSGIRRWVLAWRQAEPLLRQLKKEELRRMDTALALQRLAGAFRSCRIHFKPSPHSGLVEQQRWFQKLRR